MAATITSDISESAFQQAILLCVRVEHRETQLIREQAVALGHAQGADVGAALCY